MLGAFQNTVVLIAVVVLIIVLIFVGFMLMISSNDQKWPPFSSTCPDYWDISNNHCTNMHSVYIGNDIKGCNKFKTNHFKGDNAKCNQLTYATHCGLTWDGITNSPSLHKKC